MKPTFAEQVNAFNRSLRMEAPLPPGIRAMNPFLDPQILALTEQFYDRFYKDRHPRSLIIGINPGRLGSGATGIPFTDTKRLSEDLGMQFPGRPSHEPSAAFVSGVIRAAGGPEAFYSRYFITSVVPLGFVRSTAQDRWVNCNYYDYPELLASVKPFAVDCLRCQCGFGLNTRKVIVLGKKNAKFLGEINKTEQLFGELVVLDHPRFVMQYASARKDWFTERYLDALSAVLP